MSTKGINRRGFLKTGGCGGGPAMPTFDGHAYGFIETGYHKAMLHDFNYDIEPLEGSFPVAHVGPFSLLKESYLDQMGKMTFEWVYWHMLLPGRLGHVPLLPSHMNFLGKDVKTTPQIRHAKELHVRDVMSKNVLTIKRGASLAEAVNLMTKEHVSGLPVLDENGRLTGILTQGDLQAGLGFKVIELNGATSEARSIYDPRYSIIDAWRTLRAQWSLAFEIGETNRALGAKAWSVPELIRMLREAKDALAQTWKGAGQR